MKRPIVSNTAFTTPSLLESETGQALVEFAQRVVVTADHTNWGVRGLGRIVALDEVDALVSDVGLADDARTVLGERIEQLILVGEQRGA